MKALCSNSREVRCSENVRAMSSRDRGNCAVGCGKRVAPNRGTSLQHPRHAEMKCYCARLFWQRICNGRWGQGQVDGKAAPQVDKPVTLFLLLSGGILGNEGRLSCDCLCMWSGSSLSWIISTRLTCALLRRKYRQSALCNKFMCSRKSYNGGIVERPESDDGAPL